MAKCFTDDQIQSAFLNGTTIAVVGFGNQGRAQANNLRDSGHNVIVGNREDEYRQLALEDQFPVMGIAEAASRADVLMLIIPDSVQAEVYAELIEPNLRPGATLSFPHGFALYNKEIHPRSDLDVVLVAPKEIGEYVRDNYVSGEGIASLIAVHHDASGHALETAAEIAKGIGGARKGAFLSTVEEETVTDLFGEQVLGAGFLRQLIASFKVLVEAGYDPDVVALELYASGELADVMAAVSRIGFLPALKWHSPASRYGQLARARQFAKQDQELTQQLESVLGEIRNGEFARDLALVSHDDYKQLDQLADEFAQEPVFDAERRILAARAAARTVEA